VHQIIVKLMLKLAMFILKKQKKFFLPFHRIKKANISKNIRYLSIFYKTV
jgi:hypothetical protein